MIRSKNWNQARCDNCAGWHFAIELDENMNVIEYKCCKCGRLEKPRTLIPVLKLEGVKQCEDVSTATK
jgi:hypothetical protein